MAPITEHATASDGFRRFDFYRSTSIFEFATRIAFAQNSVFSMKGGTTKNLVEVNHVTSLNHSHQSKCHVQQFVVTTDAGNPASAQTERNLGHALDMKTA